MRAEQILGSKNRVRVLRALYSRDGGSGRQIARAAGLSASAANVALTELVETGFVLRSGTIGKHAYELNRDHLLAESVGRVFAEEASLVTRMVELARRQARGMRRELLGVGIAADGGVTLALRPLIAHSDPQLAAFRMTLRTELGMTLSCCVEEPPDADFRGRWIRVVEEVGQRGGQTATREETLRFFGLQRKKLS